MAVYTGKTVPGAPQMGPYWSLFVGRCRVRGIGLRVSSHHAEEPSFRLLPDRLGEAVCYSRYGRGQCHHSDK